MVLMDVPVEAGGSDPALKGNEAGMHAAAPAPVKSGATSLQEMIRERTEGAAGSSDFMKEALRLIPVKLQVVLGNAKVPIGKVMQFAAGSTIELDQKLSEPVTLIVNGRQVAKGELVVVNEETGELGVTITEVSGGSLLVTQS